jgi:hypothetical protein
MEVYFIILFIQYITELVYFVLNWITKFFCLVRITEFSDFVRLPVFYKLENTTLRKLDISVLR